MSFVIYHKMCFFVSFFNLSWFTLLVRRLALRRSALVGLPSGDQTPAGEPAMAAREDPAYGALRDTSRNACAAGKLSLRPKEGAKQRRERRQRAEARLRLVLARDAARVASHRGGPAQKPDNAAKRKDKMAKLEQEVETLREILATLVLQAQEDTE